MSKRPGRHIDPLGRIKVKEVTTKRPNVYVLARIAVEDTINEQGHRDDQRVRGSGHHHRLRGLSWLDARRSGKPVQIYP